MTGTIAQYLDILDSQREAIFAEMGAMPDAVLWYRPGPKVWSIGEHLDHTRVINLCARRLMIVYFPLASLFARPFRRRPYKDEIDDVYRRPNFPMNVGWIWPPKYTPRRPVGVDFLHEALRRARRIPAVLHPARRSAPRPCRARRPGDRRAQPGAMAPRPGLPRRPPLRSRPRPDRQPGVCPRGARGRGPASRREGIGTDEGYFMIHRIKGFARFAILVGLGTTAQGERNHRRRRRAPTRTA